MKTESELRSLSYEEVNQELDELLKQREQVMSKLKEIEKEMAIIAEVTGSSINL